MSQIIGNPIPVRIGKEIYLASHVSMGEWQTFAELLQQDSIKAMEFLLYCSLHRADSNIKVKTIRRILKRCNSTITSLIDAICNLSLPKIKTKVGEQGTAVDSNQVEQNTKIVYRILSRMHGWTPQQISDMSPAQIYLYMMGGSTGTGIEKMSSAQYQSFLAAQRGVRN